MADEAFAHAMSMDKFGMFGKTRKRKGVPVYPSDRRSPTKRYSDELQYQTEYKNYKYPTKKSKKSSQKRGSKR